MQTLNVLDKNLTDGIYALGRFVVAPLLNVDLMAGAYLQMKREGVLSVLYYESDPGLPKYLASMTAPSAVNYGCFVKGENDTVTLAGVGHIAPYFTTPNGEKKAEISVAFMKDWQRRSVTIPFCQLMLEWTFDRTDIDYLFGTTPEKNKTMLAFLAHLGFGHTSEPIPYYTVVQGAVCGVYVSWMSKAMWQVASPFVVTWQSDLEG